MICSKMKIMIFLTMVVMLLFTPFLLDISPGGKAQAMAWLGGSSGGSSRSSVSPLAQSDPETKPLGPGEKGPESNSPAPVPEPATMLLFGAGAVGLAAFRKKFRKK
jgi:hypothetical protein